MKYLKTLMGSAVAVVALAVGGGVHAGEIDLTNAIGDSGTINGATYTTVDAQPTGTGYIDSFVRVRDASSSTVQGYNTTVEKTYQNDGAENFNHEITVGEIGFLDLNGPDTDGGVVMRFLLDINQTGANPLLLLSEVQIFLSLTPNQDNEDVLADGELAHLLDSALVYQMDAGDTSNGALLNYDLNGGSGSGDMILDIPIEMFAGAFAALGLDTEDLQNGAYLYLYSRFERNNDGYEEWTHFQGEPIGETPCDPAVEDCGPNFIPEPNSMLLFGLGLLGSAIAVKRGRRWDRS